VDCSGTLYIADTGNNTIRKLAPDGVMITLAGENGAPGCADGQGAAARFNSPLGIAVDLDENVYVTDQGNSTIRKITANGTVTTIAGAAGEPGIVDGLGAEARFCYPAGLAVDDAGNLYVADPINSVIRKIDPAGNVSALAGVARTEGSSDGTCADAMFSFPVGLAVGPSGVVYVADTSANTIRLVRGSPPEPPLLRLKIVYGQLMVSWPVSATGWVLESRSDLSPNGSWAPVPITPVVQGCNFVVTTTLQTPAAFFRLQHQ
jgi:sugar lactone lactonase YvrE